MMRNGEFSTAIGIGFALYVSPPVNMLAGKGNMTRITWILGWTLIGDNWIGSRDPDYVLAEHASLCIENKDETGIWKAQIREGDAHSGQAVISEPCRISGVLNLSSMEERVPYIKVMWKNYGGTGMSQGLIRMPKIYGYFRKRAKSFELCWGGV